MSLNKEKVNEILADMKEEERKKQEVIKAEVDKFLEVRLEYYVAMILNGEVKTPTDMKKILICNGCENYNVALESIDKSLAEYDWYRCLIFGVFEYHIVYMSIYNSSTDGDQFDHVKERQIELGLRPDRIDEIRNMFEGMKDKLENNREFHEKWNQVSNEKQKTTNNRLKILAYFLIVISITLFAFLK